jgi:hypothetical protein
MEKGTLYRTDRRNGPRRIGSVKIALGEEE